MYKFRIFGEEYPDLALRRIFYPTKEFRIPRGVSTICLDLMWHISHMLGSAICLSL